MHPATLHGVGVITKLYFAVLWYLRNQTSISNLESRLEVIQGHTFWYQSKAHVHIPVSGQ